MNLSVTNATMEDMPAICRLFEEAISFQKNNDYTGWSSYDKAFIELDIQKALLFKITRDENIACIFSVCYSDPLIWRNREKGDALYLHRIVSNRSFAGEKMFFHVLGWAKVMAREKKLSYIRMDTWAANKKIIDYYKQYGFRFIENYTTPHTEDLPEQHRNLQVALLELNVRGLHDSPIHIIGAGAIGKTLAAFLKLEGKNVNLLRAGIDNTPGYKEDIGVELPDGRQLNAEVTVSSASDFSALEGTVVLTTKSFVNAQMARLIKKKAAGAPVLILQNGLGVEQPFIENGFTQVYRAVLFASCQFLPTGILRFKPAATSPVGVVAGDITGLHMITEQISNDHFVFRPEENIQPAIWTKAIVNCVFNSVCPLLEADNGVFHRNPYALYIAEKIISECLVIAKAKGLALDQDAVLTTLLKISRSSDGQLISTYQDIKNRRRTEIETLNLAVAAMAENLDMAHAVKETRLLGELVKLKSELFMLTD